MAIERKEEQKVLETNYYPPSALDPIIINSVYPQIEDGIYPIKRVQDEEIIVTANIFRLPFEDLRVQLIYRHQDEKKWASTTMILLGNDNWQGQFKVSKLGIYYYSLEAWVDSFKSWRDKFQQKLKANYEVELEIKKGLEIVASRTHQHNCNELISLYEKITHQKDLSQKIQLILDERLLYLLSVLPDLETFTRFGKNLSVIVDRKKATFSSWYELFPRSLGACVEKHGTFKDLITHLPYIANMGFDVIYLPPIHPIGVTNRKGKNNSLSAQANDPGSPWAVGAKEGGHTTLHPQLGTMKDFTLLLLEAKKLGLEIAIDIAFQCSPDHPFVHDHPEWFSKRADGSIQHAENFPKKYQDIYPLNFYCADWKNLWGACLDIFLFWIKKGIKIFRIDNPHTKPFVFWEWVIKEVKKFHPDVIFLSEAFTRMQIMYQLAKIGFTQSYTYFTWRNTKKEIITYINELNNTEVAEYFRPNFWPNTPDILPKELQTGGKNNFVIRLVLAATLSSNYGIYGPAYELAVNKPMATNHEEYLDSEKYEIKYWEVNNPANLNALITKINFIRKTNKALQETKNIYFHQTENDYLLCFSRKSMRAQNQLLIVINLDPFKEQSGFVELTLAELGLKEDEEFKIKDLLNGENYLWKGSKNYVILGESKYHTHLFLIDK